MRLVAPLAVAFGAFAALVASPALAQDPADDPPEGFFPPPPAAAPQAPPRALAPAPPHVPPAPPVAYYPLRYMPVRPKPKYAPDPQRTGALIGSSLLLGLGTLASGAIYAEQKTHNDLCAQYGHCPGRDRAGEKAALYTMG